jgi:hypothetical protein
LIELAVEFLAIPQLQAGQPLRTKLVDTIDAVTGAYVERAVTAHVIRQIQAQAQVVGTSTLAACVDHQGAAMLIQWLDAVLHTFEIIQAVQCAHVLLQAVHVQRFAQRLANMAANHRVADFRVVLHMDFADDRGALRTGTRHGQRRAAGASCSALICVAR